MKAALLYICCVMVSMVSAQPPAYKEKYRPQFHFTPPVNWMNDPNGLVYHKSEYHLFYQYNPFGNRWGHMSWGHAVSKDLVHWQHLPLALAEEKDTMIFSGSCVMDINNTSGFAIQPGQIPMVAVYTAHIEGKNQSQHIAYSLDDGRTWTKYNHNPVLDLNKKDFRDPHVFWYEPQRKWVMSVVWPIEKEIHFYQSKNLKQWQYMSRFGPAGDTTGIWECPALVKVPVEGKPNQSKWLLMHSPAPYMQYFVGEFDGYVFSNQKNVETILRPDYGPDYYAAIIYNNLPANHVPVSIGWVNNWNYANDIPTTPWKSAMSLPRRLSLKKKDGKWILIQQPVDEIRPLRSASSSWRNINVRSTHTLPVNGQNIELKLIAEPVSGSISGVRLAKGNGRYIEVGYDYDKQLLYIDRSTAGENGFNAAFPKQSRYETTVKTNKGKLTLHIFFDKSILEVFSNNGEAVMTAQLFPAEKDDGVELFSNNKLIVFEKLDYWSLKSSW
jgi:fructan beta-fructosidase